MRSGTSSRRRSLLGLAQSSVLRKPQISSHSSIQRNLIAHLCVSFVYRQVFGPASQKVKSLSTVNTSTAFIYQAIKGTWKVSGIPPTMFPVYTDVRTLGVAHVKAAELDVAKGKRYIFSEGYFVCLFLSSTRSRSRGAWAVN